MLQVIKSEEVRAGEPRLYVKSEADGKDAIDSGRAVDSLHTGTFLFYGFAIVDRPAPAPTPAPGLDLDAVEAAERVMTPGPWRHGSVERHHVFCGEGDRSLLCPEAGRVLLRMNEHFPHDSDAAGIVALRNAAPALIAEVRSLRAAIAEAKRLGREACEYYADAPDLHDPACASLDQRGACDCTAGIAAALEAL